MLIKINYVSIVIKPVILPDCGDRGLIKFEFFKISDCPNLFYYIRTRNEKTVFRIFLADISSMSRVFPQTFLIFLKKQIKTELLEFQICDSIR